MSHQTKSTDVIVVGGGLARLAAATLLARAGRTVTLLEKSSQVGGRAMTQNKSGFQFNQGPHALYRLGAGAKLLAELGVPFTGGSPSYKGYILNGEKPYPLPVQPLSLLTSRLLSWPAKVEVARLMAGLSRINPEPLQHLTVRQWLEENVRRPDTRQLFQMYIRVSTYAADIDRQSAGAALTQLQRALKGNVYYLDGGWQTLVDGLRRAAQAAGVTLITEARVAKIEQDSPTSVCGVRLADGQLYLASAVLVAAGPEVVSSLVEDGRRTVLGRWAEAAIPVTAACLDVGLKYLPNPHAPVALSLDQPLYLSAHSAVAKLAPEGEALIHIVKYLDPNTSPAAASNEQELENQLDLVQPGWRKALVEWRFLPKMVVSNALVTAAQGGTAGRPGPAVPGLDRLYVAGDWVGPEGMLSDASLASAKQAAEMILAETGGLHQERYLKSTSASMVR